MSRLTVPNIPRENLGVWCLAPCTWRLRCWASASLSCLACWSLWSPFCAPGGGLREAVCLTYCLESPLPQGLGPAPRSLSHPDFSQILWMSASPGTPFFCRLEAAYSPISEVQASLKLLTRIGGNCLFSVLIRNWLMTMEAANSDTTYYSFSPRPFLVWSCLAPSMLCSWHPALWLQSPLGTDAVKASLSYRRHCYV